MSGRHVLVTGGCGYIGSHVTRQLSELGYRVTVLDNLSRGYREALLHDEELVVGDAGDAALLAKLFTTHRFTAVLHFAAFLQVGESVEFPLMYYRNNVVNTVTLLDAVCKAKIPHFIFSSTGAVYGETNEPRLNETMVPAPESPYARTKHMIEGILADVGRATGLHYLALRYFNVAGAHADGRTGQRHKNSTHLVKAACEVAIGDRPDLTVFGTDYPTPDGTCVRDYIHVVDLADAHVAALKHIEKGGGSGIYNCGYGTGSSVKDVLAAVDRVIGRKLPIKMGARRPGDVACTIADPAKLKRDLGWKPKYDNLDAIVKSAYDWEKGLKKH